MQDQVTVATGSVCYKERTNGIGGFCAKRSGEVQTYLYPKLNCHRSENCGNGFVLWYVE
jgi:hypothetical protein